jgi:hypothetical protein
MPSRAANPGRKAVHMVTLTKAEILWLMNMVKKNRDNSKALKDYPGQRYAALHALEYENMESLYNKLDTVLKTDKKRIAIR